MSSFLGTNGWRGGRVGRVGVLLGMMRLFAGHLGSWPVSTTARRCQHGT